MEPSRLDAVRAQLSRSDSTHLLITDPVDAAYVCGFVASSITLLVSSGLALLFTDFRYRQAATRFVANNRQWRFIEATQSSFMFLREHIPPKSRIGIQAESVTIEQLALLKKACRGSTIKPCSNVIARLSCVKQPAEISAMRRAAAIGDKAFGLLLPGLRIGQTEREVAWQLEAHCHRLGSQRPSFDTIVLFGANSALPHGTPGKRRLCQGDLVLIDFGCTVNGFCSDMTRTFFAGKATEKKRHIYSVVLAAQMAACNSAKPGQTGSQIDAFARDIIKKGGFGHAFGHGTGHGVGRRIHEAPRIAITDKSILSSNTVFTIEPGIYLPGFCGVRIEDLVLMTEKGITRLSRTPRDLVELNLK